jgi:hypothetical protein
MMVSIIIMIWCGDRLPTKTWARAEGAALYCTATRLDAVQLRLERAHERVELRHLGGGGEGEAVGAGRRVASNAVG